MLSVSASVSIISRLYQEFGSSCSVLKWAQKSCYKIGPIRGVSQRKRKAFRAWQLYAKDNYGKWKKWAKMPLSEYREEICSIWGFGRWSADMIAIFHLGRMDVWPETDTGLQKACEVVFKNQTQSQVKGYIAGCETVAALYLWALINKKLI
jgi:DNA-3-methyladenine glycosylase II